MKSAEFYWDKVVCCCGKTHYLDPIQKTYFCYYCRVQIKPNKCKKGLDKWFGGD